ncbi:hypothetical protein [Streptomyces parvulus]|uniref:hypothetical protein n=1 Tax=Streptomyces parvulus TaxID=146923 RepID=UPI003FD89934
MSACARRGWGFSLTGGFDAEDLRAHPLLHGRELVPAVPNRADPPAEVFALASLGTLRAEDVRGSMLSMVIEPA